MDKKRKKAKYDYEVIIINPELIPAISISATMLAIKFYNEGKIKLPNHLKKEDEQ